MVSLTEEKVVPGDQLCQCDEVLVPGQGVHVKEGVCYSTLLGYKILVQRDGKKYLSVQKKIGGPTSTPIPSTDDIVTCKVISVNPRQTKVTILSVGSNKLSEQFRAMIKKEDIRATEKDTVEVYKCFRPGDLVLARVISIGDYSSYFLSTAENELGVVFAQSAAGVGMVPISWCEMKCPKTGARELRKVAKVVAG